MDYDGTLLLVSHDRTFLNNVVTSTIAFEGNANVKEYIGGYNDWLRQRQTPPTKSNIQADSNKSSNPKNKPATAQKSKPSKKKLSYNLQRELEQLPNKIDELEQEIETLTTEMANPEFYQQAPEIVSNTGSKLKQLQQDLDDCFTRWEELEA